METSDLESCAGEVVRLDGERDRMQNRSGRDAIGLDEREDGARESARADV